MPDVWFLGVQIQLHLKVCIVQEAKYFSTMHSSITPQISTRRQYFIYFVHA